VPTPFGKYRCFLEKRLAALGYGLGSQPTTFLRPKAESAKNSGHYPLRQNDAAGYLRAVEPGVHAMLTAACRFSTTT
jgi:hypothetical protein